MKLFFYLLVTLAVLHLGACSSSENSEKQILTGSSWELEYLNGPNKTLDSLFPINKPQLTFEEKSKKVMGNDGCNGYTAPFTLEGKNISFGEPGPATLMYCGEGDAIFRESMKKIEAYKIEEGNLVLLSGDTAMMRFHKMNP